MLETILKQLYCFLALYNILTLLVYIGICEASLKKNPFIFTVVLFHSQRYWSHFHLGMCFWIFKLLVVLDFSIFVYIYLLVIFLKMFFSL